jgi:hypothetical protein
VGAGDHSGTLHPTPSLAASEGRERGLLRHRSIYIYAASSLKNLTALPAQIFAFSSAGTFS